MLNHVRTHPRLFIAAGVGLFILLVVPAAWGRLVGGIIAWDVAASLYLMLTALMISKETTDDIRERAALQDESGWTLLGVSAGAAAFSLCAIIGLLSDLKDLPDDQKALMLGLAIYTILASWFFLQMLFTLHYAHEYYGSVVEDQLGIKERGGLIFPGDVQAPSYIDFAYFSFTIGMAAQTSDTCVGTSTMRALALAHGILTFFFNTVILALSINIAASLL